MKYEVILFDADETLFDFKKSEKYAFEQAILEFNIDYREDYHLKIYSDINTAIWKEFECGLITQEKLKVERFRRLSNKLKIKFDEISFSKSYLKHLSHSSFLYGESANIIETLSKNYKLAIITNGLSDVQSNRIRKSSIAKYFDDIVISEEVGISKPTPKIFEITLNNLNYNDKSKVLMVGDSLTSDIQGGVNFGIDTCWYNPNKILNKTTLKPTYEISELLDLYEVLGK
ncbi:MULTISPECIES: YjjG family noncanonical pyrimidine nucleotidase [Clostridium]|uniref:YjjG family noncanonical pyrimidine nucleotidase n=1 Tax=Clostridium TaxID=1485 RepID=UPI00214A2A43|nr:MULTISPECIES: YjjG family noncanonical pyrimidine nucleotidase [Clostridium]MCR1950958.1 YjjG family noncanonical pyrimidine nucleotidase [Clostridium sp. DSM 100503]MDI9217652.1 YjjG family noncanonical pyrimidine nucleotidase [Clostridium tertium]